MRVQPQIWLPVGLIEGRVSADIKQNLAHAESKPYPVICMLTSKWPPVGLH